MLDSVLTAVCRTLEEKGIRAFRAYPESAAELEGGAVIAVGAEMCKCESAGLGDYIGLREGRGGETDAELYGRRLELCISLEVFSPFDGDGTAGCFEQAARIEELLSALPSGLSCQRLETGEVTADGELFCFRCRNLMYCTAFMVAESVGGDEEFLDFKLKGTVLHGE